MCKVHKNCVVYKKRSDCCGDFTIHKKNNNILGSSGVIVFVTINSQLYLLLGKQRKVWNDGKTNKKYGDHLLPFSGHLENDECPCKTAKREFNEEFAYYIDQKCPELYKNKGKYVSIVVNKCSSIFFCKYPYDLCIDMINKDIEYNYLNNKSPTFSYYETTSIHLININDIIENITKKNCNYGTYINDYNKNKCYVDKFIFQIFRCRKTTFIMNKILNSVYSTKLILEDELYHDPIDIDYEAYNNSISYELYHDPFTKELYNDSYDIFIMDIDDEKKP